MTLRDFIQFSLQRLRALLIFPPWMMTAGLDYQASDRNAGKTMLVKPLGRLSDKNIQNLVFTLIFQWKKNLNLKTDIFNHFYLLLVLSRADV